MLTVLIPVGVLGAVAVYYALYFRNIKKAGGFAAAGATYWREQFGLWPNERVVAMWVGCYYMGKLVPESQRSTSDKAIDFLTSTTVRGARVYLCFTDHQRMAMAVEMNEGDAAPRSSVGMAYSHRPAAIHSAERRPLLITAAEAFPGSPDLPRAQDCPRQRDLHGKQCTMSLVLLADAQGTRSALWVDAAWLPAMRAWCAGAPVAVDPRWVPAPAVAVVSERTA